MNDEGVYRTAPAPPGLLNILATAVSRAGGHTRELELSLSQMCAYADIEDAFRVFVLSW